jgi:protein-disulfide isomerase
MTDTPSPKVTRRQWLALAIMCAAAFAIGGLLRQAGPPGEDVSDQLDVPSIHAAPGTPALGPRNARVTVSVFTDYQCPACRAAHPRLLAAAAEEGDVRIAFRDWPVLGPASEEAAQVALASARQGIYVEVHDALMRERRELTMSTLRDVVERAGGNWAQLQRDLADPAIERVLARNREDAFRLGASGTPTYLIGPYRVVGAQSEGQFARAIGQARRASLSE